MTDLLYLQNTYQFEADALFVESAETEKGLALILDQTIFYPQGGGQPCDLGEIVSKNTVFNVRDVRLNQAGQVLHFGEYVKGVLKAEDLVHLKIDKQRRVKLSKLHSAGHLLDCAVSAMDLKQLVPAKGYHFPQGPYVEYQGVLETPANYIDPIQSIIQTLVEKDLTMVVKELTAEEAETQGVWAPPGKSARVVAFEGYETCGCGGTHVISSSEIGDIRIRKISSKKGLTRIAYSVAE